MFKCKSLIFMILLAVVTMFAGCSGNAKIDQVAEKQEEILTKLTAIENNQKDIMKLFNPRRPTIDYNKVNDIPLGSSYIRGNADAPVTIVEFSDFQCPYCAKLQTVIEEVLKTNPDNVKLVFKDFPLSFHQHAKNASIATRAAGEQGKYWEMHDMIFINYKKLSPEKFNEFAKTLNLDMEKFSADFKSGKYDKDIQADINLGKKLGVSGTPTLFINGKRMQNRSPEDFKKAIESYIKK